MLIPTPGPYVETRNGLIMNYCDILMGGSRSIRLTPRRGNFSIRENQKKGTLKYAKRTQFIGLSTPTIRYTNFPPQKRLQKKDSLNMRNEAILIVPKNVIGGSSDPPHPGRSEDLPGTIFINMRNEAISPRPSCPADIHICRISRHMWTCAAHRNVIQRVGKNPSLVLTGRSGSAISITAEPHRSPINRGIRVLPYP